MQTFTTRRNLVGVMTGDDGTINLSRMDTLLNEADKEVCTLKPWSFRQKTKTLSTETDNAHQLPNDCARVLDVTVTIGSTKYSPKQVKTRDEWDRLNQSTSITSNTPEYWFIFGKVLSFYPGPSSATTNAITVSYHREIKDLSIADYTTGTITTITSGSTTVTGSGTTWTAQMAGRYIRITDSSTANTGDGYWYEIASVTSATVLELTAPYNGTSIAAGSAAYTIGQVSIVPEDFQMVPMYRALELYFTSIKPEKDRADKFKSLYIEGVRRMNAELGASSV